MDALIKSKNFNVGRISAAHPPNTLVDAQRLSTLPDLIRLNGRPELLAEVKRSEPVLAEELAACFQCLLKDKRFIEAVASHMPPDETNQARVSISLKMINGIAKRK